jgi:hypothetical protein
VIVQSGGWVVRAIAYDAGERCRVVKAIGLDASEGQRVRWQTRLPLVGEKLSRDQRLDRDYFAYWYPLFDWAFDRQRCVEVIREAGLPVPMKSACFFCPATVLCANGSQLCLVRRSRAVVNNEGGKSS